MHIVIAVVGERSKVFGNVRFWFCPNLNPFWPNFASKFCLNFAQIQPSLPKFNQFCPKNFCYRIPCNPASPAPTALTEVNKVENGFEYSPRVKILTAGVTLSFNALMSYTLRKFKVLASSLFCWLHNSFSSNYSWFMLPKKNQIVSWSLSTFNWNNVMRIN